MNILTISVRTMPAFSTKASAPNSCTPVASRQEPRLAKLFCLRE